MYPFEVFKVDDRNEIARFLRRFPFATLVATTPSGGFEATHLPLLVQEWDDRIVFRGHAMRATEHWRAIKTSNAVFASFLGPDAPVLGSWQLTRRYGGTWNYQAVHIHGEVETRDQDTLLLHLEELKDRFETNPSFGFSSLPQDYLEVMVPQIECFDIVVSDLKCIYKLSQNRGKQEFDRTVEGLREIGGKSALVAEEMERLKNNFYT